MTQQHENRRNWHLDRTISLTHVGSTIALSITAALYIINMDKRIELQQAQLLNQQVQIQQVQTTVGEGNIPLRRDIDRIQIEVGKINDKLDRLAEKFERPRYLKDYQ